MYIRPYIAADRQACLEIFKSNMPLYFDPSEFQSLINWLDAKDRERIAYPGNLVESFLVLELKNQVIACGGFYIPAGEKKANIVWGMVENSFHKMGFGKNLLEHRIKLIKNLYPGHEVCLDTTQHTFRFFEGQGFSVTKITENSYGPDLHRYDMSLELSH